MCDSCGDARRVTQVSRRDFLKTGAVAAYALSPAIGTGGTVAPTAVAQATKRNPQNAAEVRMKRIAIEEAFVTQDIATEWKKVLFESGSSSARGQGTKLHNLRSTAHYLRDNTTPAGNSFCTR